MSKKSYIFHKTATLLVGVLLLTSCLKEDYSNCPEDIRVYFDVAPSTSMDDLDQMNLYVFDSDGRYLQEYHDGHIPDFSPDDYYINCSDLLPGKYRFIAWSGKDETCYSTMPEPFVKGKTAFDEALLKLECSGMIIVTALHHLFHSELPATVMKTKSQRFIMPLAQLTNTIHIRTIGLPADNDDYSFNIIDNNSDYFFDASFANDIGDAAFNYISNYSGNALNQPNATLNVMRLEKNRRTPKLLILNKTAGTTIFPASTHTGDLIELILTANPQNNFETTHTYDIIIKFAGDTSVISITVNGWEVLLQNVELY